MGTRLNLGLKRASLGLLQDVKSDDVNKSELLYVVLVFSSTYDKYFSVECGNSIIEIGINTLANKL